MPETHALEGERHEFEPQPLNFLICKIRLTVDPATKGIVREFNEIISGNHLAQCAERKQMPANVCHFYSLEVCPSHIHSSLVWYSAYVKVRSDYSVIHTVHKEAFRQWKKTREGTDPSVIASMAHFWTRPQTEADL